jgi:uncharacterized protein YkwD
MNCPAKWLLVAAVSTVIGCAHREDHETREPSHGHVEKRTIVEKTPHGTRTVTITTTTERVEAPAPPARPADPYPSDPRVRYNVELLASYRKKAGLPPLLYDAKISAFALDGSRRLSRDHSPHAHFRESGNGNPAFGSRSAENQGDPGGVPALDPNPDASSKKQISLMLKMMFDEGPGGGHHDNMMNPKYRRVGIGLHDSGGKLYLTNDFSD